MAENDFDDILIILGTSKWNMYHFVIFGFGTFMIPSLLLSAVFMTPAIDHSCNPEWNIDTVHVGKCSYSFFSNSSELGTEQESQCVEWNFDEELFQTSMTQEFQLVCGDAYLRPTYQTVYMLGNLFGAPVTGYISDKLGRKRTIVVAMVIVMACTFISTFIYDIYAILFLRFVTGFSQPAIMATGYILCLEICEPKIRSAVGVLLAVPWAFGTMWFGTLGYLIRDWRWLQQTSLVPGLIVLGGLWFFSESPRWLIVKGRYNEAMTTLKTAAKWNKSQLPSAQDLMARMKTIQLSSLSEMESTLSINEKKNSLLMIVKKFLNPVVILLKTPELRRRTLLMFMSFFVSGTVFYGLSLNAVNFNLDPFMYMIVGGLMEVPAYTITVPIIAKFGRVPPTVISYFICGGTILTLAFIPTEPAWLVTTLAMIGKFCISSAYQFIYLSSSEIFPTEVRIQAIGATTLVSRIGALTAPYITESVGEYHPWVPSAIFGILSLVAGIAAIFLPESRDSHLLETIYQLETEAQKKKENELLTSEATKEEMKILEA